MPVALVEPPDLPQTPLYSPAMSAQNAPLPDLPRANPPQALPAPPAQPEPKKKPVVARHPNPKPAQPRSTPGETAASGEDTAESDTGAAAASPGAATAGAAAEQTPPAGQQAVLKVPKEPETSSTPIGPLTAGNTTGSVEDPGARKRETVQIIQDAQKGVNEIKRTLSADEKKVVSQIKSFLEQAQKALDNGDTDGANTLATKAKLMLDELTGGS